MLTPAKDSFTSANTVLQTQSASIIAGGTFEGLIQSAVAAAAALGEFKAQVVCTPKTNVTATDYGPCSLMRYQTSTAIGRQVAVHYIAVLEASGYSASIVESYGDIILNVMFGQ